MTISQATKSSNYQNPYTDRATPPVILKTNSHSSATEGISALSPVTSTAPNSASSSPLSFNCSTNNNNNNNNNKMVAGNFHLNGSAGDRHLINASKHHQPDHEYRRYASAAGSSKIMSSRGPLSPQSAPNWSSSASTGNTTPVPSVIHTQQVDTMTRVTFSAPYLPSIDRSNSGNMSLASNGSAGNLITKKTNNSKVTGKKKHHPSKQKSVNSSSLGQISSRGTRDSANSSSGNFKKQRRLERNRLSAQLSRRRRKQYLEELEERVVQLSLDMDSGRRNHAFQGIDRILELRQQALVLAMTVVQNIESTDNNSYGDNCNSTMLRLQLDNFLQQLENTGPLSRTINHDFLVLNSFFGQQLKSFSLPSHSKFILWLTLQGDLYFRGGRAASERLSASRIGERMLSEGNDKVTPADAMWPLVCNEIGLSYELEERVRQYQRTSILQDRNTWLDRHTARSSDLVMQTYQDAVGGAAQMIGRRESEKIQKILTPLQRIKYLSWASKNSSRIKKKLQDLRQIKRRSPTKQETINFQDNDVNLVDTGAYRFSDYKPNQSYHLAANLYILNHHLRKTLKDFPYHRPSTLTPEITKKLMRRASFESLGQQKYGDGHAFSQEGSFPSNDSMISSASTSSLKNSSSCLSLGGSVGAAPEESGRSLNQITPQVGEQAAGDILEHTIGFVKSIIPPVPKPIFSNQSTGRFSLLGSDNSKSSRIPNQDSSSSVTMDYHDYNDEQYIVPAQVISHGNVYPLAADPHVFARHLPPPPEGSSSNGQNHPRYLTTQISSQIQDSHQNYQEVEQLQPIPYYPMQQIHYTSSNTKVPSIPAPTHANQQEQLIGRTHVRKSSFLPPHLNAVPEDMFPGVEGTAADFFELEDCLMDDGDDWGIGIGLDTSSI